MYKTTLYGPNEPIYLVQPIHLLLLLVPVTILSKAQSNLFPYGLFFRNLGQEHNFLGLLQDDKKEEKALN